MNSLYDSDDDYDKNLSDISDYDDVEDDIINDDDDKNDDEDDDKHNDDDKNDEADDIEDDTAEDVEDIDDNPEDDEDIIEDNSPEDDSGVNLDDIMDDEKAYTSTRKKEYNITKSQIENQMNKFKFINNYDTQTALMDILKSEKNANVFIKYIPEDKIKQINILRFLNQNNMVIRDQLNHIKENKWDYNSDLWEDNREEIKKEVAKLQTKIEVMESYIECPKCKQKKIQFYNVQLRRADEPPTTFNNCMNKMCLYSWRTG